LSNIQYSTYERVQVADYSKVEYLRLSESEAEDEVAESKSPMLIGDKPYLADMV
jgi:hypothetical protein